MDSEVLKQFKICGAEFTEKSIWPYAPVHVGKIPGIGKVILKQAIRGEEKTSANLQSWQHDLVHHAGLRVVQPVPTLTDNPRVIDQKRWVIYPFIEGDEFSNQKHQLQMAGEFLGRMHSFRPGYDYEIGSFDPEDYGPEFTEEVKNDLTRLHALADHTSLDVSKKLMDNLNQYLAKQHGAFIKTKLPMVNATWDYKASNILFDNNEIVGIDLENSGRLPRIFDLALALLLFNSDLESEDCPARCFTAEEWGSFLSGYKRYIALDPIEMQSWQNALNFVFADEAIWAICDTLFTSENRSARSREFATSLLQLDLSKYLLN